MNWQNVTIDNSRIAFEEWIKKIYPLANFSKFDDNSYVDNFVSNLFTAWCQACIFMLTEGFKE